MLSQPQSRREFLQSAVRATLLTSLAWLGVLLFRRQQNCLSPGGCVACNISDACALPWKEKKK